MVCVMPKPCKFPSLDSCQKSLCGLSKEVDLVLHPVIGLVLQVADAEKFHRALGLKNLDPFYQSQQTGLCFTAIEEDGGDKRLAELELACDSDGVGSPDPL